MADTKDTQGSFNTNNSEAKQQDNHSETAASGGGDNMRIILIAAVSIALCIGAWLLNKFM